MTRLDEKSKCSSSLLFVVQVYVIPGIADMSGAAERREMG